MLAYSINRIPGSRGRGTTLMQAPAEKEHPLAKIDY